MNKVQSIITKIIWPKWKYTLVGVAILVLMVGYFSANNQVKADEVAELQAQIAQLSVLKAQSEAATKPLESELNKARTTINNLKAQLDQAEALTVKLETDIKTREDDLAEARQFLSVRVRSFYKLSRMFSPLLTFLSSESAASLTRGLSYRSAAANQDRKAIIETTEDLVLLAEDQEAVKQRKEQLAAMRKQFEADAGYFAGKIAEARALQKDLGRQIAELSKRQQEILAAKQNTFQTSVGEVPLADDPNSRLDFNPGFSPAMAVFSFGAPHYKGMSQYGALGRAMSGQNVGQIITAYYGNVRIDVHAMPETISTDQGVLAFEDHYLLGIAEMPASWASKGGMEALKSQAIAARTYALASVGWRISSPTVKSTICTSESCQVYQASKATNPAAAAWHQAVQATRGMVVVSNNTNEVFSTMYASTSGGYQESYSSLGHTTPSLWDTAAGREGWTTQAYEKIAGSPWFYKAWYKSRSGDACGRTHPWLNASEMADIMNAYVVLVEYGVADDRVTPIGPCWGGNPYTVEQLRDKARTLGKFYSSVSGASVTYSNNGVTANVTLNTDRGQVTISGADFKKVFNLRAPGRIAIKSGLYNVETK